MKRSRIALEKDDLEPLLRPFEIAFGEMAIEKYHSQNGETIWIRKIQFSKRGDDLDSKNTILKTGRRFGFEKCKSQNGAKICF
jgi:hypothetical protein